MCDDCLDNDGDGAIDRDDDECTVRANGGRLTFGDPANDGKALAACAKAIAQAGARRAKLHQQRLQSCTAAAFACVQLKPGDPTCLTKAAATCGKQLAALPTDDAALAAAITKRCSASGLGVDALLAETGLGFDAERDGCAALAVDPLASVGAVTACIARQHRCRAEQLVGAAVPRAAELLTLLGRDPAVEVPCLPSAAAGSSLGLAEALRAKAAVKCQKSLAKAALAFATSEQRTIQRCATASYACVATGGAPECTTKAGRTCTAAFATRAALAAKLRTAATKACGTLDAEAFAAADGLGFAERDGTCAALGTPATGSALDAALCLARHDGCRVEQLLELEQPRLHELLELGGVGLP